MLNMSDNRDKDQWLPGAGGKEEWGMTVNGYKISFWGNRNILELCGYGTGLKTL